MALVGFDREVAAANGYEIRTDAQGVEYSVPIGTPSQETLGGGLVTPQTTVTGNCGSSYVELYDVGTLRYHMKTGFGVTQAVVSYSWSVTITGPAYSRTYSYGGGLLLRNNWDATQTANVVNGGWYSAKAVGSATTPAGAVCASLGPISTEPIY